MFLFFFSNIAKKLTSSSVHFGSVLHSVFWPENKKLFLFEKQTYLKVKISVDLVVRVVSSVCCCCLLIVSLLLCFWWWWCWLCVTYLELRAFVASQDVVGTA